MSAAPRLVWSDSALLIEFAPRVDPAINARAVAVAARVAASAVAGVRDVVPTYRSVAVYFDPLRTDSLALETVVHEAIAQRVRRQRHAPEPIEVPVCYGGEHGPDLPAVAEHAKCTEADVVGLHSGRIYRVYMLGFVPGFAYMGEVDERIAMPRHRTPRVRVPACSVGITGRQTGVYPSATPGGWQLIGRTPLKPLDPARAEPFLFGAGAAVRFVPISVGEYERLAR
ncbi:MAG TPA: 5-oxoprolinase subunit PxpB [Vicinamibacterales bacterium]